MAIDVPPIIIASMSLKLCPTTEKNANFFIITRNVLTAAAQARNRRQLYVKLRVYDAFSQDLFGIFLNILLCDHRNEKKSTEEIFASRRAAAFSAGSAF